MTTFVRQPDESRAVLGLMRDLAERGHGYEANGVAGWARATEVNQLLEVYYAAQRYAGAAEELRLGCASRGYYERLDVRVNLGHSPGRKHCAQPAFAGGAPVFDRHGA
jgi:hypothetical protein